MCPASLPASGASAIPWLVDDILYESLYTCPLCMSVCVSKCDLLIRSYWIRAHPHDLTLTSSSAKTLFPKKVPLTGTGGGAATPFGDTVQPLTISNGISPSPGRRKGWTDSAIVLLLGSCTETRVPRVWILDFPRRRKCNICKVSFLKLLCLKILLDHHLCFCPRAETNGPRCSEWGESSAGGQGQPETPTSGSERGCSKCTSTAGYGSRDPVPVRPPVDPSGWLPGLSVLA